MKVPFRVLNEDEENEPEGQEIVCYAIEVFFFRSRVKYIWRDKNSQQILFKVLLIVRRHPCNATPQFRTTSDRKECTKILVGFCEEAIFFLANYCSKAQESGSSPGASRIFVRYSIAKRREVICISKGSREKGEKEARADTEKRRTKTKRSSAIMYFQSRVPLCM